MPASYLHGVEIIETNVGPVPVSIIPTAVIGLIGTAPSWAVLSPAVAPAPNTPALVSSASDAANFGPLIQGYSIPYALATIQQQGPGQAIVVNVFDPTRHTTTVTAASFTFPASGAQVINLGHMGISSTSTPGKPVVTNTGATTTYVEGTDYTVDYYNGPITAKSGGAITTGEVVKVTFSYNDPSKVVDADVVGTVSAGVYTGLQALLTTFNTMGFFAKILIAPTFSKDVTVASALTAAANTLHAVCLIDSPPGTLVATAIANRGAAGNPFDTSDGRTELVFPCQVFTDTAIIPTGVTIANNGGPIVASANSNGVQPLSAFKAGVMAAVDYNEGFWVSASNHQITGSLGPDVAMYMNPNDPNQDPNLLNQAGITTIFNSFGTGIRIWGNRTAAFPTVTAPIQFVAERRASDVVEQSVILNNLQMLDKPLTAALISTLMQTTDVFLHTIVQEGGLIDGFCTFDATQNPPTNLGAGHLTLGIQMIGPPPMERLTFNVQLNTNLLNEISAAISSAQGQ